jgi:hypothetical protein
MATFRTMKLTSLVTLIAVRCAAACFDFRSSSALTVVTMVIKSVNRVFRKCELHHAPLACPEVAVTRDKPFPSSKAIGFNDLTSE